MARLTKKLKATCCPNCTESVGKSNEGCILHDMIQVLRERDTDMSEADLLTLHVKTDADAFWNACGAVIDDLESGAFNG